MVGDGRGVSRPTGGIYSSQKPGNGGIKGNQAPLEGSTVDGVSGGIQRL